MNVSNYNEGKGFAASDFVSMMAIGVVLVGLHSRGLPNSPGEVKVVTLPHCGWLVMYPTRFWWRAGMGVTRLAPDVEVEWSAADIFEGRDPLLDAAVKYKP